MWITVESVKSVTLVSDVSLTKIIVKKYSNKGNITYYKLSKYY